MVRTIAGVVGHSNEVTGPVPRSEGLVTFGKALGGVVVDRGTDGVLRS